MLLRASLGMAIAILLQAFATSYTKEDLLASGRGELFGAKGPQLPAPNMLMMDRVVKMTETGG
ncbi:hypothetical protein MJN47_30150, partial [Salmonella enterica subsp. enterica serovar Lubbock]|nr:hypothetical protein [Salmonella enterica subsp. enterica serovar Lubbock]